MTPDRLLAHFDCIAEVPDAIPRLRVFILDLAVRGKLTEQLWNDEPVSDLLRRVNSETSALLARTRKKPVETQMGNEDLSFALPTGWTWVRLTAISRRIHYGYTASANASIKDVRLLRITDIQNNSVDWQSVPGCEISSNEIDQYGLCTGDILIARTGGTIGKSFLVRDLPLRAVFASYLIRVQLSKHLNERYVKLFLESPEDWRQIGEGARGGGQPNVNGQTLGQMLVVLPPLQEQSRIVAKVDELMALCDSLASAQTEREARRDAVAGAALARLNQPTADFPAHVRFHSDHLPRFTTRPDQIPALRQTILNLAVRGKLVPQDLSDESADALLKNIHRCRKCRRTFAGLVQEDLAEPLPKLPGTWMWTVMDQIAADDENSITDGPFGANLKTEHYITAPGYRVIRLQNIGPLVFRDEHRSYIKADRFHRLSKHHVSPGDLVVAGLVDPSVRCCEVPVDIGPSLVKADCYRFSVHPRVSARYALYYLNSPIAQGFAATHHHGMTLTRIGLGNFRRIPFPLAPAAEQHRIVAKVDELMAVCDQLESQLTTAQTERRRLLDAILHEALQSPSHSSPSGPILGLDK